VVRPRLAIRVFTEDMGSDAHDTIAEITRKLLFLLEPRLDRHRVEFPPDDPNHPDSRSVRVAMGSNAYKSRAPRDHKRRVDLARAIASHLLTEDVLTAVIVHVDADRRWRDRDDEHGCENLRSFREVILPLVAHTLSSRQRLDRLCRLILLVPFRSIESWLFTNCREALAICEETHPRNASAVQHFIAWQTAPEALEDGDKQPKDLVALGSRYNLRLARTLSARHLYELGRSFTHTVDAARLSAVADMLPALCHGTASA
jgi:hypothetical protein